MTDITNDRGVAEVVHPAVKWLLFSASMVQVVYFVFWLMMQTQVMDIRGIRLTMSINCVIRALVVFCAAIFMFRSTLWQVKLSGIVLLLNRIAMLVYVFPKILEGMRWLDEMPRITFLLVVASDLLFLTSRLVRKNALWPMSLLLLLDAVTLVMTTAQIRISDLMFFWTYSIGMALTTGILLFVFYKVLEHPKKV